MPKFEKGSIEMKNYMAGLRAKRGEKRPITTNKQVSKEHIKEIMNEALEKYYMVSTPVGEVPSQVVKVDKSGNGKLIDTLTKAGNLKKIDGENVIKLEPGNHLVVKTEGKKYNDAVNIPTHTIVHKPEQKKTRAKIIGTEKEFNDVIDVKNENIPIQKIIHNHHQKVGRRQKIEPYTDIIEEPNVDIEPLIKKTIPTTKISKTRAKK
ncbi:MAG: hypothetical protein WCJ33_08610 [Pseudomonadota bacterium]